jgi:hypothetical protein
MLPGRLFIFLLLTLCSSPMPIVETTGRAQTADSRVTGVFDLTVTKSAVLKTGTSRIVARSAYARLVHALVPGNSDGLEVLFLTTPFTDAAQADVTNNDAKELKKSTYATMVLFLDKQQKITQVNVSYVVPGTTVGSTVAWRRDEIEKYFSDFVFDGTRLVFKSRGAHAESGDQALHLSWNLDVNLPVIRDGKR